ncbi:MAG: phosphoenolpyruvate carboxykinase (GTP) [Alphaproteobacteria bacterium]|nr:phosphoenolpyruvate carboxykinase (GTP) [Alphaproteobacteria bacterium]
MTEDDLVHPKLKAWLKQTIDLCGPDHVHICDGSPKEYATLMETMVAKGNAIPLPKRPGSYLFRSDPSDVARVEARTFINTRKQDDAGPSNNWADPDAMRATLRDLYKDCMKGRTLYVIPFSMGPLDSPLSRIGVEITDSPYVVVNMHIMTRVGTAVLQKLGNAGAFIPCLHSSGKGAGNPQWVCAPMDQKYISHFPEENVIASYGSGYGGNALLGKKCLALRLASAMAWREGWMAEHMLLLRLTSPEGKRYHIGGAFPSACGKTNLAMITPTLPGWKAECLGDDIVWMKPDADGRLWALNPEAGFFGVAPGTSRATNPNAMKTIEKNTIFTNCALTDDGDVWWEGLDREKPSHLTDWQGQSWTPDKEAPAAHPNARFTASATQCPILCQDWDAPEGVPLDAILFGGRRAHVAPLVTQALNWDHGVFLGATLASETTAANIGAVGKLRYDPMAMTPFCGYNMGDYFQHWLTMGDRLGTKAPAIFYVNWFRKGKDGAYLWPGYGDNCRVLKWICDRVDGKVGARETPVGYLPCANDLDLSGLNLAPGALDVLLDPGLAERKEDQPQLEAHLARFGDRLPQRLRQQAAALALCLP